MRRRAALLAVGVVVLLAGCDSDRRAISRDDLPDVPDEPTAVVELDEDGFDPAELEVLTVDLVEFVNVGEEDHGVRTEDSAIHTGLIFPGESTLVMFDEAATYEIYDVADDTHSMTVVATEPAPED